MLVVFREAESAAKENDFCLDDIPLSLMLARPRCVSWFLLSQVKS
jgi:hypothetical protein